MNAGPDVELADDLTVRLWRYRFAFDMDTLGSLRARLRYVNRAIAAVELYQRLLARLERRRARGHIIRI